MSKLKIALSVTLFITVFMVFDAAANNCNYWDDGVKVRKAKYKGKKIDEKNPENIVEGIECLLKLEGDKSRCPFSGATRFDVSDLLPRSTVEICALYRISWLFYEKYEHAGGIALRYVDYEANSSISSDEAVKTAYESYRKWFSKVKEIGLAEARKQKLDPLADSEIRWY